MSGHDLLYLRCPNAAFSAKEKAAVVAFVVRGGSLLLVFDEERRQSFEKTGVNDLLAPFGLRLNADIPYLHNQGELAKAEAIHSADRGFPSVAAVRWRAGRLSRSSWTRRESRARRARSM